LSGVGLVSVLGGLLYRNEWSSISGILRVDNISFDTFKISKNLCIAQMVFEQLSSKPIHTYDQQVNASFNNEWQYKGLSHYKDNYEERTTKE
jgi:hypothetical protein